MEDGLSLTRYFSLRLIEEAGAEGIPAGRVFRTLMLEVEPLPYLGDLMFWAELKQLQCVIDPLFEVSGGTEHWPERRLSITAQGRALVRGELNFLDLYTGTTYWGGLEINRSYRGPRWARSENRVIPSKEGNWS